MRDDIKRFRARQENADAKTTAQVKEVTEKGFALGDRLRGEQARSGGCLEGRSSSHLDVNRREQARDRAAHVAIQGGAIGPGGGGVKRR